MYIVLQCVGTFVPPVTGYNSSLAVIIGEGALEEC